MHQTTSSAPLRVSALYTKEHNKGRKGEMPCNSTRFDTHKRQRSATLSQFNTRKQCRATPIGFNTHKRQRSATLSQFNTRKRCRATPIGFNTHKRQRSATSTGFTLAKQCHATPTRFNMHQTTSSAPLGYQHSILKKNSQKRKIKGENKRISD